MDKSLLRRSSQTQKKVFKEKIVQIYGTFFRGEDISVGNANFWDELFLLKLNSQYIESEFDKLTGEQLVDLMESLNKIFYRSVEALKQDNVIRIVNALQTICCLTKCVLNKCDNVSCGFDAINILIGFDCAEQLMRDLIRRLNILLLSEHADSCKPIIISMLLIFVTGTDNISQNTFLEYLMMNSLFESIIEIIGNKQQRQVLGSDSIQLLTLLIQYRKYESANPYIVKLSILDDEMALTGFSQVISSILSKYNSQYEQKIKEIESIGFFATLSNMVGNMFIGEDSKTEAVKANDCVLLALYEAIHLNRNFITTLTHSHTQTPTCFRALPSTSPTNNKGENLNDGVDSPSSLMIPSSPSIAAIVATTDSEQRTNLLVTLLEYCSIVSQDIKDQAKYNSTKLCFIILTCIAEDQYANSLIHDNNVNFRVTLHRLPMRHRRNIVSTKLYPKPLVCFLIDLMVEFIVSHLMKNFPLELYLKSLGILHRIMCYQKKSRVRLDYGWAQLWTALISLLKFLVNNEGMLVKKFDIFYLATKVVNIFNLFITFGDMFLNELVTYDQLYYEVIRMNQIFDIIYSMSLRHSTQEEGQWKDSCIRLGNALVNIRAISNHFTPKLEAWSVAQHLSSLTQQQVLEIVKGNYETLSLKMQESLDQYDRYTEKPKEITSFFLQLVRSIVGDVRRHAYDAYLIVPQNIYEHSGAVAGSSTNSAAEVNIESATQKKNSLTISSSSSLLN